MKNMRRSLNSLLEYTMGATDGEIGTVQEFYFDDHTWTIRYIIVEAGNWLMGRKVLISPQALLPFNWNNGIFPVKLTKEQIKKSPEIDTEKPVSREQEVNLMNHYLQEGNWGNGFYAGGTILPMYYGLPEDKDVGIERKPTGDSHLRSSSKVTGYNIKATDGEIGAVKDFLLHPDTWEIDFLVVDTGDWLPGKKVLLSPRWIKEINWEDSAITVNALREQIRNSPEYNHGQPFTDGDAMALNNYYGEFVTHIE